jgi:hypothetical protein
LKELQHFHSIFSTCFAKAANSTFFGKLIETIDFFGRVPKLVSSFSQGLLIAALMK